MTNRAVNYFGLNRNEKTVLDDLSDGKLKNVGNVKREISRYRRYARQTLRKTKNINIRLANRYLQRVTALAAEKGLPYQTLISSLLHQYSEGKIKVPG